MIRTRVVAAALLTAGLWAADPPSTAKPTAAKPPATAPAKPEVNVPAEAVVATINGKNFTAAQVLQLLESSPIPNSRTLYQRNPQGFLRNLGVLMLYTQIAEEAGLDKQSPYKEAIDLYRQQVLSNAALSHYKNQYVPTPDEQQAYYKAHAEEFRKVSVRMIYFPFSDENSEAAAKQKAAGVAAQARIGADFVKLALANSEVGTKAGEAFEVKADSSQPPAHMKGVLLAAKAGTVTDPLRHDNGYYVFRVESVDAPTFEKVKDEIYLKIQDARWREWLNQTQQKVTVQIHNEAFFKNSGQQ